MSSINKKFRDIYDKLYIKKHLGRDPKHRCPKCHRFTLYRITKKGEALCFWCELEARKKAAENEKD
jgi:uncharacterized protein (DUF983 family)